MEVLEDGDMEGSVWAEPERAKVFLSDVVCPWQPTLGIASVGGEDCRYQTSKADDNNHSCYPPK